MYKIVIQPVLLYSREPLAGKKEDVRFLEMIEIKMVRWIGDVSLKLEKKNEDGRKSEAASVSEQC